MGAEGKVLQYPLKNDPTGDEMYNYRFQKFAWWLETVGKVY
jgi:hypothetical protein